MNFALKIIKEISIDARTEQIFKMNLLESKLTFTLHYMTGNPLKF